MGTPLDSRADQAAEVIDRLAVEYPDTTISLDFATRFELLVAVILSAQCTDERVNETRSSNRVAKSSEIVVSGYSTARRSITSAAWSARESSGVPIRTGRPSSV